MTVYSVSKTPVNDYYDTTPEQLEPSGFEPATSRTTNTRLRPLNYSDTTQKELPKLGLYMSHIDKAGINHVFAKPVDSIVYVYSLQ